MRYAIFSDIHGNRPAWEAVLRDMRQLEVQVMVCLGDVVGYGPKPLEVLRAIRAETDNILMGNHDAAASGVLDDSIFNPTARQAIAWTRQELDQESLSYLANLPMAIESEGILFVHAELEEPGRFGYIEDANSALLNFAARDHQLTFIGHTHVATVFRLEKDGTVCQLPANDCTLRPDHRYIVNVGSVGEPRTLGDIRARYAVYDSETGRLYFRRIPFDPEVYRTELNASGLDHSPYFLAVYDEQREAQNAAPAMADFAPIAQAIPVQEVRSIVMPQGIPAEGPLPVPKPTRRGSGSKALLVLLPIIAMAIGVGIFFGFRSEEEVTSSRRVTQKEEVETPQLEVSEQTEAKEEKVGEPPNEVVEGVKPGGTDATVPETPKEVVEGEDPKLAQPENPPPAPAKPELPAPAAPRPAAQGFARDLVFYASFDEAGLPLKDHAGIGREITEGTATLGQPGKIGSALQLQGKLLRTLPRASFSTTAGVTISCWLRFPDAGVSEGILLAVGEGIQFRLQEGELFADLDRNGEGARLALPTDGKWHHLMVTNEQGRTQLWWDHKVSGESHEETALATEEHTSLVLGSEGLHAWMDELVIWAKPLSQAERQFLHQRGKHGSSLLANGGTIAHWRFEEESNARRIADATGRHPLGSYRKWSSVEGIAPDPVPLNSQANALGAQISHVGERSEDAGAFRLTGRTGFTYEGWFKFSAIGGGGTLGGTTSTKEAGTKAGWCLAVRHHQAMKGFLAFMYETGNKRVQALARDVTLFDNRAHHIAATWQPGEANGRMVIYIDNKEVAAVDLPLAELHANASGAFRIEGAKGPFTVDEVRFSEGVLAPAQFLTAGKDTVRAERPKESLLERRDREIKERKAGGQPEEPPQ